MFATYNYYGWAGYASYGSLDLTAASPPQSFEEPLSLPDVQGYLRINDSMLAAQSSTLQMMITAAREQAEILQNRDLVVKQWDLSLDYWTGYHIHLRPHTSSLDLAQYTDNIGVVTPLVEGTDYVTDFSKQPGIVLPPYNGNFPSFTPAPSGAILLRFTAGVTPDSAFWQDAGARVKIGMQMLIAQWFTNRLPFGTKVEEFPYAIASCLRHGAVPTVK